MKYEFDWDRGNESKSLEKHGIGNPETESVFDDPNLYMSPDEKHSLTEKRYICIGKSVLGRVLFIVFTRRMDYIRVISSRPANAKNRMLYEN